jgi:hypothetical protein|tara:strand:+ start:1442 stop:2356 length:915 start_codon:yes stop_codon:yes gene_type:complete
MELFPTDYLLYGPPGSGKTSFAVSAMWDWAKKEKLRDGRIVFIGRERNDYLHIPDEFTHTSSGLPLAVKAPLLDSDVDVKDYDKWLKTLEMLTRSLIRDAQQGKENRPEVLVIDGWSEFGNLYENTEARQRMDGMARWGSLLHETYSLVQRLDPIALEMAIVTTARIGEKRKAKVSKRGDTFVPGDPEYVNSEYVPAFRGQMRFQLPYNFSNMWYMQTEVRRVTNTKSDYYGRMMPTRAMHVLKVDEDHIFDIKNQAEHEWLDAGYAPILYNALFEDVNSKFLYLRDEYAHKEVASLIRHEDVI